MVSAFSRERRLVGPDTADTTPNHGRGCNYFEKNVHKDRLSGDLSWQLQLTPFDTPRHFSESRLLLAATRQPSKALGKRSAAQGTGSPSE